MDEALMQYHRDVYDSEDQLFQCRQCPKHFSTHIQLTKHIENHAKGKTFKCTYCGRCFKQQSHLQQHIRRHTGERPYRCHLPDCGRAFIQLSNLQQHLKNHDTHMERAKHKPFECDICRKGFVCESSLLAHRSRQHLMLIGNEYQACPMCCKLCISSEAFSEHMRNSHNKSNIESFSRPKPINYINAFYGKTNINSVRRTCSTDLSLPSTSSPSGVPIRMWPCTACHCVYAQEAGLLNHLENFKMDPKHTLAAQHMLNRVTTDKYKDVASSISLTLAGDLNYGLSHVDNRSGTNESHQSLVPLQVPPATISITSALSPSSHGHIISSAQGTQNYHLMPIEKKE